MSFWNTLENLRQKPEPARQAIALFLAIIITAIVVGIWLYFKTFPKTPSASWRTTPDIPSPFQVLWNYIKSFGE